jgi:hypothetical protein
VLYAGPEWRKHHVLRKPNEKEGTLASDVAMGLHRPAPLPVHSGGVAKDMGLEGISGDGKKPVSFQDQVLLCQVNWRAFLARRVLCAVNWHVPLCSIPVRTWSRSQ